MIDQQIHQRNRASEMALKTLSALPPTPRCLDALHPSPEEAAPVLWLRVFPVHLFRRWRLDLNATIAYSTGRVCLPIQMR